MIAAAKSEDAENPTLSGDDAFTLYDTYGFPLDITTDVATEAGVVVDVDGFEIAMETARNLSRDARVTVDVTAGDLIASIADELAEPTRFTGYGSLVEEGVKIRAMVRDGERVRRGGARARRWTWCSTPLRFTPRAAARSATRAR